MMHLFALFWICLHSPAEAILTASTPSRCRIKDRYRTRNLFEPTIPYISKIRPSVLNSEPFILIGGSRSGVRRTPSVEQNAGFLDDLFQGKFFGDNHNERQTTEDKRTMEKSSFFSEMDFRKEVEKRSEKVTAGSTDGGSRSSAARIAATAVEDVGGASAKEKDDDYDGYALRDAIDAKWGYSFDLEFQPVQSFGFRELYLNVLPFRLGSRKFRHETEYDYLCHLQAVVEILVKYDQLEYVLTQLEETKKVPRAGTVPIIAVPFRLDLTEDELDAILA